MNIYLKLKNHVATKKRLLFYAIVYVALLGVVYITFMELVSMKGASGG